MKWRPDPTFVTIALLLLLAIFIPVVVIGFYSVKSQSVELDPYSGVLMVQVDNGQGSCFVVAERDGWWYALTAKHVVEQTSNITVDEEMYLAEIVRTDAEQNMVLIRFKSDETYRVYSFDTVDSGESCTSVGWSRGSQLVYRGYIVSVDFNGFIAANGGVSPGCSGGVLLNGTGDVIGMTVAISTYSLGVFDSTALYIPARYAESMVVTIK